KPESEAEPKSKPESGDSDAVRDAASLLLILRRSGERCIDAMGTGLKCQDPSFRQFWEAAAGRIGVLFGERDDVRELLTEARKSVMKPVFDALEDRDFKQYDRDLAYAVIDMIA
ncbi:MAG: hypothetical protein Q4D81_13575, partial [Eubacteriales bacterium]|nr:hypothetical protein [Eubacteriales bacterium]